MDINPDGCITQEELVKYVGRLRTENNDRVQDEPFAQTYADWKTIFNEMDMDGDRRADFHEFYTATVNMDLILT